VQTTIDRLLSGSPFVEHQARLSLLGERPSARVRDAPRRMVTSPDVQSAGKDLQRWPVSPYNSHKSAGHALHRLTFLADLGLARGILRSRRSPSASMAYVSCEGPSQVVGVIGPAYGGTGKETWLWALCDAPLLVYALSRFGYGDDLAVRNALGSLTRRQKEAA
jgi:hypothetical protein